MGGVRKGIRMYVDILRFLCQMRSDYFPIVNDFRSRKKGNKMNIVKSGMKMSNSATRHKKRIGGGGDLFVP